MIEAASPFVAAFLVALVVDWAWAVYILATAEKKPFRAGGLSAFIVLLAGTNTLLYMHDKRTIAVAALGAFLGTYVTVNRARKHTRDFVAGS